MELQNSKWPEEVFLKQRPEILSHWSTGKDVNLKEAVSYHQQVPSVKRFSTKLIEAKAKELTYAQPRAGVALDSYP